MLTTTELTDLVFERLAVTQELIRLTQSQRQAIAAGHMSWLLELLDQKQSPLVRLVQLSKRLATDVDVAADSRLWPDPQERTACREAHRCCESLLQELMAMESDCEQSLLGSRSQIQQQLQEHHSRQRVMKSYAGVTQNVAGSRLDLSSD